MARGRSRLGGRSSSEASSNLPILSRLSALSHGTPWWGWELSTASEGPESSGYGWERERTLMSLAGEFDVLLARNVPADLAEWECNGVRWSCSRAQMNQAMREISMLEENCLMIAYVYEKGCGDADAMVRARGSRAEYSGRLASAGCSRRGEPRSKRL